MKENEITEIQSQDEKSICNKENLEAGIKYEADSAVKAFESFTVTEAQEAPSKSAEFSEEDLAKDAEQTEAKAADYSKDLDTLKEEFTELNGIFDITGLENPLRYAALRDLGLTAKEAYLATSGKRVQHDNRAHLAGSVPKRTAIPAGAMSASELRACRELFSGVSDAELIRLYKRVTSN